jgi:hypothetical protein
MVNEISKGKNQSIFEGRMLCQYLPELADEIHEELNSGTITFTVYKERKY